MLQTVDVGNRSLSAYRGVALDTTLDELVSAAEPLRDLRVLHLSATPYGGGVAELLRSLVPLLNDLGLAVDWRVISGDESFFKVTKQLHDALQGADTEISDDERATYQAVSVKNAAELVDEYDVVVVHDPQPAGIRQVHGAGDARWIWRCHIDTSEPSSEAWDFLRPFLADDDAAVYTMDAFLPPDLPVPHVEVVPPAIDPLSPTNLTLRLRTAREVLSWIGIELDQPLVTQVARFDPWKDPLCVIEAYCLVRDSFPDLQLALAGSMALDDPDAWEIHREIKKQSEKEPLIHVFTNLTGVGNVEVNALQRLSQDCIQKSIREGFGLVVSEALWKRTPVVAGRAGGIPLQMADGAGGVLVESVEECATAVAELLADRERAQALGEAGRERVREHFLLPRLLLNEVGLLATIAQRRPPGDEWRDPVCGIVLAEPTGGTEDVEGTRWAFARSAAVSASASRPSATRRRLRLAASGRSSPNRKGAKMAKTIRDAMTKDPRSIDVSGSIVEAARLMRDHHVGSLPVVDRGRLVGMITDRDITTTVVADGTDPHLARVGDFCTPDPVVVASDATLAEALQLMARNSLRRLPVVDDTQLVGILAQADVALEEKEEATGELVQAISKAPETERR